MNPTPMEDPAVKALAFEAARPLVAETLEAIANAAHPGTAARAQGFALKKSIGALEDDERSDLEVDVDAKTIAIAADQIQRLLSVSLRFEFSDGMKARDTFDAQALKAAEDMWEAQKDKSNG